MTVVELLAAKTINTGGETKTAAFTVQISAERLCSCAQPHDPLQCRLITTDPSTVHTGLIPVWLGPCWEASSGHSNRLRVEATKFSIPNSLNECEAEDPAQMDTFMSLTSPTSEASTSTTSCRYGSGWTCTGAVENGVFTRWKACMAASAQQNGVLWDVRLVSSATTLL